MDLFIIFIAQYLLYIVILFSGLVFFTAKRKEQLKLAKLSLISFPLVYIAAKISSYFINNPRPFVIERVKPLFSHVADNGFPSDHTLLAMTIAAIIFTYNKKFGVTLALLAFCIGIARVFAHVHHIEDIIGSIVIAILEVLVAYWSLSKTTQYLEQQSIEKVK